MAEVPLSAGEEEVDFDLLVLDLGRISPSRSSTKCSSRKRSACAPSAAGKCWVGPSDAFGHDANATAYCWVSDFWWYGRPWCY